MKKNLLVVGHTRSGGHFLMNSISMNFRHYTHHGKGKDLCKSSNANQVRKEILAFGDTEEIQITRQQVWSFKECIETLHKKFTVFYIIRDGRDVVGSLFDMHTKTYKWSKAKDFSEFIRKPFVRNSYEHRINIRKAHDPIESWVLHCRGWLSYLYEINAFDNFISYENLYYNFDTVIADIGKVLNIEPNKKLARPGKYFNSVRPRKGCPGQWKDIFTSEDLAYYYEAVKRYSLVD